MGLNVRLFDWRDLPALHRYRHQYLYLDSARLLTQGPQYFPMRAVFAYLASATGTFTYRSSNGGDVDRSLIGQVIHKMGDRSAHMAFIAPDTLDASRDLPPMVERMQTEIGDRGALQLIAEVQENSEAFEALRNSGFAIYARQRVWQLTGAPNGTPGETSWKRSRSHDTFAIRSLYCNLVPNMVQQIEPPPGDPPNGMFFRDAGDVQIFVELKYGPAGIFLQPFVHPDTQDLTCQFVSLIAGLTNRRDRPVYTCVRSYQSWLETVLEDLGAEPGPRQAVMVKRLAVPIKEARQASVPGLEIVQREAAAPMTHSESG